MGYSVNIRIHDVVIEKENLEGAFDALSLLSAYHEIGIRGHDDMAHCVMNGLDAWDHGSFITPQGVEMEYFNSEKWHDQEELYYCIAPFVKDGGVITCRGEDGEKWRYVFKEGEVTHEQGDTVWLGRGCSADEMPPSLLQAVKDRDVAYITSFHVRAKRRENWIAATHAFKALTLLWRRDEREAV